MRAVGLALFLQAMPAAWSHASIVAKVTEPLPSGQRDLVLTGPFGTFDAIWLHDDGRDHLAVRDPLGPPVLVVRSDGERLGVELLGKPEVVSRANPAIQLLTEGELELSDLGRLLAGRLPEGTELTRVWGGWRARKGDLRAGLSLEGELLWAEHSGIVLRDGQLRWLGQRIGFELGPVQERAIPDKAFVVGARRSLPAEQLGIGPL